MSLKPVDFKISLAVAFLILATAPEPFQPVKMTLLAVIGAADLLGVSYILNKIYEKNTEDEG